MVRPLALALLVIGIEGTASARPLNVEHETQIRPVNCIDASRIQKTLVRGDQTVDFAMMDGQVYRSRLPKACPGLGLQGRFRYTVQDQALCSVDLITLTREPHAAAGISCKLGRFQPLRRGPQ